ncbi:MAG: hypothetical protein Q7V57_08840 [Actinomycetota bacterium]|nr:hypothetical protein [Actinomycetota bacterium]
MTGTNGSWPAPNSGPPPGQVPIAVQGFPPPAPRGPGNRSMMGIVAVLLLVAVGVVVFVATRGDDAPSAASATDEGRAYVDAMVEGTSPDSGFNADEARCMATSVVDQLGVDALQAAGITPETVRAAGDIDVTGLLTEAGAVTLADSVANCIDWGAMIAGQLDAEDAGITAEQAHCIGDKVGESELIREVFVQGFMGSTAGASQESARALGAEVVTCIDFGEMMATAMTTAGVPISDQQAACIGTGMNSSVFLREMFAQQFTGITATDTPEPAPTGSSLPGGASVVLAGIVQEMFGTTDEAMTEALALEMAGVLSDCGVDIG